MFETLKDGIDRIIKSRFFVLSVVMILLTAILLQRMFALQIVNGEEYLENYTLTIKKERDTSGTRGNIYDRNGKLLAYNELSYSVTIEDSEHYASTKEKNRLLNAEILEIVTMIEGNGDTIVNDFPVIRDKNGELSFSLSGKALKRFLADIYGRTTIDDLKYNKTLKYDENEATPEQVYEYLRSEKKFNIKIKGIDEPEKKSKDDDTVYYTEDEAYKILNVRFAMSQNSYQKYVLTTIANGVSDETIAMIKENSVSLPGVDISENTIRKYNNSVYFSHIIGYTGKISQLEYDELSKDDDSYTLTDVVGKSGIEKEMEQNLQGKKGKETFYVDNVGRIAEVIDKIEPSSGNNIYLSIDSDLQIAVYNILEQQIAGVVYSQIENIKSNSNQSTTSKSDIKIPIDDVYFALIDNNVIDIQLFSKENANPTEHQVYQIFLQKQEAVLGQLMEQLTSAIPANYEDLSEEMQVYMRYILSMLTENEIFMEDVVDADDEVYQEWKSESISLSKYLQHAIAKDWIDIVSFNTDSKYSDSAEIYDALLQYIQEELKADLNFSKRLYKYMINQDLISGTQISLILFEQGILAYNEEEINNLNNQVISAFTFIKEKIKNLEITPAQLALDPCTGSSVITDVNTGELLACVSYPGYDTNRLANTVDADYYSSLQNDRSLPLYNNATQQRTAPGSTFKPITAAAVLTEGVISTEDKIDDKGIYEEVTPPPKCWIYPGNTHGQINVTEAIRDSCNYYFYEASHRLGYVGDTYHDEVGIEILAKYATLFGLNKKTNIEIPETEPQISDEYTVTSSIGQGNHNFTTIGLARYVMAIANQGNIYDLSLIDKITDSADETLEKNNPQLVSQITEVSETSWSAIQNGMRLVVENSDAFSGITIPMAGKTGTAQEIKTRPNHALFVGYAPFDNPEIAIATRIAYGYTSANAAKASSDILKYYFNLDEEDNLLSGQAQDIQNNTNGFID